MIILKVEKANSREFKGKSGSTFTSYSIASGGKWYQLSGKNKELIAEGDEITGIAGTKEYLKKDGSPGISNTFELADPVILDIINRLTNIEKRLSKLDGKNSEKKPEPGQERPQKLPSESSNKIFYEQCKALAKEDRDKYDGNLFEFGKGKITSAKDILEKRDEFLKMFKSSAEDELPF